MLRVEEEGGLALVNVDTHYEQLTYTGSEMYECCTSTTTYKFPLSLSLSVRLSHGIGLSFS